jgi:hypothetical protein
MENAIYFHLFTSGLLQFISAYWTRVKLFSLAIVNHLTIPAVILFHRFSQAVIEDIKEIFPDLLILAKSSSDF